MAHSVYLLMCFVLVLTPCVQCYLAFADIIKTDVRICCSIATTVCYVQALHANLNEDG